MHFSTPPVGEWGFLPLCRGEFYSLLFSHCPVRWLTGQCGNRKYFKNFNISIFLTNLLTVLLNFFFFYFSYFSYGWRGQKVLSPAQILDLLHISHFCMVFTCTEIKVEIWNSFLVLYEVVIPDIGMMVRVFANGPGDMGLNSGRVIPKTQKMVLNTSLLNTQYYKVQIKGKVNQSRERCSALHYTLM